MSYQSIWFKRSASQLQLLERSLNLESVREIIGDRLPLAIKELELKGLDPEDPNSWWDLLFIDGVIRLENAQGKPSRVAICVMDNWRTVVKTLQIVKSKKFQIVRTDLGIDQHWIVFTESKKPYSNEDWMDLLYGQIDQEPSQSGCALIEM
jgi:hypothetical protein